MEELLKTLASARGSVLSRDRQGVILLQYVTSPF
jgi:hypothetical protein